MRDFKETNEDLVKLLKEYFDIALKNMDFKSVGILASALHDATVHYYEGFNDFSGAEIKQIMSITDLIDARRIQDGSHD